MVEERLPPLAQVMGHGVPPTQPKPKRLIHNRARCKKCFTVIESVHRHQFISCPCGAIFVDGGRSYKRVGYNQAEDFEDLSVWQDAPV